MAALFNHRAKLITPVEGSLNSIFKKKLKFLHLFGQHLHLSQLGHLVHQMALTSKIVVDQCHYDKEAMCQVSQKILNNV